MPEPDADGVGLSDALEALRAEFAEAKVKAAGNDLQFPIETVTLELRTVLTRTREGKAGFTVPFVNAEVGGGAARGSERTQTLTVVLGAPVDAAGRPVKVASETDVEKR